ncbi:cysteine-rich with EGF-like domain protein 2 [Leptotrombidium deliense]|uniref:Cysteine-rich with EGF-like domain protein 2 n=1 Tax=Leptotrombidium deliense TaxID=299467 RepID=A0A443SQK4_9ACAR|nr:cysteine-rich with EGF-like domain protein 2 [Leptotrombidium deliense]
MKYGFSRFMHTCRINTFTALYLSTCVFLVLVSATDPPNLPDLDSDILNRAQKIKSDSQKLGPCQVCKSLISSFEAGATATARGKFEGGDASWEESRLGSYNDSELRLIEIQESLCEDLKTGKEQCQYLAEEQESEIEFWWKNIRPKDVKLFDFLCIERMQVCCPPGTFGQSCAPCPGHPDNISGENETTNIPDCQACHSSCSGHCRDKGPKGCEVCKEGYLWDNDYGCMDIDECVELNHNPCKGNTFCVNTEGSHECFRKLITSFFLCPQTTTKQRKSIVRSECDKACNGCNGDGPDLCYKCADGYTKKENICNIYVASVIGLFVALYIAVAEYTVRTSDKGSFYDDILKSVSG